MNQKHKDEMNMGCSYLLLFPLIPFAKLSILTTKYLDRVEKAESRNLRYYDIKGPNPWKKIAIGMSTLAIILLIAVCSS